VDGKIEQAKAVKDNIKETNLAVRLGGKEFVVINF
jgi:GGDEF domain-containing protein